MAEIKRSSDITFRYIPSDQNPADLPTRGLPVNELSNASLWWHGPMWLEKPEELWPEYSLPKITPEVIKGIQTNSPTVFYEVAVLADHSCNDQYKEFSVCGIDEKRYSLLRKLLRITVYCLKFIKQLIWNKLSSEFRKTTGEKHKLLMFVLNSVSKQEILKLAAMLWVYRIQQRKFSDVMLAIKMKKRHCLIQQLGLKFDNIGLLRCYGRY